MPERRWENDAIAAPMGYQFCVLFPRARDAIRHWDEITANRMNYLPTNICPVLYDKLRSWTLKPVSAETGLSDIPVQMYGYRVNYPKADLEIDPVMTGFNGPPFAKSAIVSFGRHKILNMIGGAFLTSDRSLEAAMRKRSSFPEGWITILMQRMGDLPSLILQRWQQIDQWDRFLGDSCVRIPLEQIMPWRVMRRVPDKRDEVVKAIRDAGHPVGTNYPPLPGVTDEGAIRWGKEVINFFPDSDAQAISEIVKRTLAQ